MRRWLACWLFVLGCHDEGVVIEVRAMNTGATSVELFVVESQCVTTPERDCDAGLKTRSSRDKLPGPIYLRDRDPSFVADVESDGSAYFRILPNAKDTAVPMIVAVGVSDATVGAAFITTFDANKDGGRRIISELGSVVGSKVNEMPPPMDGKRVELWYKQTGDGAGCLAFDRWAGGTMMDRKFVVPSDDLDCDDFTGAAECDPLSYMTDIHPTSGDTAFTCVTPMQLSGSADACVFGNRSCVDGQGPGTKCAATDNCGPSGLCNSPGTSLGGCAASSDPSCIYTRLRYPVGLPAIECTIPMEPDPGMAGVDRVCDSTVSRVVDNLMSLFVNSNNTCVAVTLANVLDDRFDAFASPLTVTPGVNPGFVEIEGPFIGNDPCEIHVHADGQFGPAAFASPIVIRLQISNGTNVFIPLRLMRGQCSDQYHCEYVEPGLTPDPSYVACVQQP